MSNNDINTPSENESGENKTRVPGINDDLFQPVNSEIPNETEGHLIHKYIIHNPLQYGKKLYWSEFLSEQLIRVVAFTSIAFIIAIFYYVFSESTYAFINRAKTEATVESVKKQSVNTGINAAKQDVNTKNNDNQSTGNDSKSQAPEEYNPDAPVSVQNSKDQSNKPEEYNPDATSSATPTVNQPDKPEEYNPDAGSAVSAKSSDKPEEYNPDADSPNSDKQNKSVKPKSTEVVKSETKTENKPESSLDAGRSASQSSESAGGDKTVTIAQLFAPNDFIKGRAEFIWQPISEVPKFSLVPLAIGAFKVTVIGILVAAPLAILAAIFTTAFAPKWLKEIMKPSIEILAGFPSVVIGFFCLITLATIVQNVFGTTFRLNSFVGGLGMAIAVIPIIFTVTEDALSAIPQSFKEASLALGASRWQTAFRVVLPAATPGVFAAIVLGFGRAFGETMIALMATGNAALVSTDIFETVRTMAATIGAEMAEVDFHGVHYGILFLIGSILFVVTFSLNAIAEFFVKNRLLKKFQGK